MGITPGPWRVEGHKESLMPCEIVKDFPTKGEYGLICELTHSLFRDQQRANAALIAAAPELLAEIERLYEAARCMADPEHCLHATRDFLPWADLANQAKAAIARATGHEVTP